MKEFILDSRNIEIKYKLGSERGFRGLRLVPKDNARRCTGKLRVAVDSRVRNSPTWDCKDRDGRLRSDDALECVDVVRRRTI